MSGRDQIQELRELGIGGTIFRASWELRARSGLLGRPGPAPPRLPSDSGVVSDWTRRLPFADPLAVAEAMRGRLPPGAEQSLLDEAREAGHGRIRCFGRWTADFGDPVDWHRNPANGERWPADVPWPRALRDEPRVGEVKLTWEAARFPHAYTMARAGAFSPPAAAELGEALLAQIERFIRENPYARGLHWFSGQEIALRLMAWVFALDALLSRGALAPQASRLVGDALLAGAAHIERHLAYAEKAVYNNHLIAEALALYLVGTFLPEAEPAAGWRRRGREILEEQAERQFYADGAYILQSHNYERGALLYLLWAGALARAGEIAPPDRGPPRSSAGSTSWSPTRTRRTDRCPTSAPTTDRCRASSRPRLSPIFVPCSSSRAWPRAESVSTRLVPGTRRRRGSWARLHSKPPFGHPPADP